jgi:hypothetical protein
MTSQLTTVDDDPKMTHMAKLDDNPDGNMMITEMTT